MLTKLLLTLLGLAALYLGRRVLGAVVARAAGAAPGRAPKTRPSGAASAAASAAPEAPTETLAPCARCGAFLPQGVACRCEEPPRPTGG